jgi:hypothetical protein
MSGYLDQPTVETRLAAYLESGDLELDIDRLRNEYRQNGWIMPTQEELRAEAIKEQREWLENLTLCENEGHLLEETADGENGTSDLYCKRCGFSQHIQW